MFGGRGHRHNTVCLEWDCVFDSLVFAESIHTKFGEWRPAIMLSSRAKDLICWWGFLNTLTAAVHLRHCTLYI